MRQVAFTIATNNYLSQACVLGKSFLKNNHEWQFCIAVLDYLDSETQKYLENNEFGFVLIDEMDISGFQEMKERYSAFEMSCALKPFVANYFISQGFNRIMYFDSDILILSSFKSSFFNTEKDFYITPHSLLPIEHENSNAIDLGFIKHGIYNAGFFACISSANSVAILNWWSNKLRLDCVIDISKGKYVDQTWLNLIPIYFDKVSILKSEQLNVAPWNLHEREVVIEGDLYMVNNKKMIFYHFSGYDVNHPDKLSKHHTHVNFANKKGLIPLYSYYFNLINEVGKPKPIFNYYKNYSQIEFNDDAKKKSIYKRLEKTSNGLIKDFLKYSTCKLMNFVSTK